MDILNRFKHNDEAENVEETAVSEKYLTFLIDKQYYAFSIKDVKEIIEFQEITNVPEFPDYAKGIINLRGTLIPVIDVRLRFAKNEVEYDDRTCIIILTMNDMEVGFIVDTVDEVIDIENDNISPVPRISSDSATRKFIDGVGKAGGKIIMIVNPNKMLSDDEMKSIVIDD